MIGKCLNHRKNPTKIQKDDKAFPANEPLATRHVRNSLLASFIYYSLLIFSCQMNVFTQKRDEIAILQPTFYRLSNISCIWYILRNDFNQFTIIMIDIRSFKVLQLNAKSFPCTSTTNSKFEAWELTMRWLIIRGIRSMISIFLKVMIT